MSEAQAGVASVVGAPFFLVGSVLWVVSPAMLMHGDDRGLIVGIVAATLFLVDVSVCFIQWAQGRDRSVLHLLSIIAYALASMFDLIVAVVDLFTVEALPAVLFWGLNFPADLLFLVAGTLEFIHYARKGDRLGYAGSFFFATGGLAYVISGFVCEFGVGSCEVGEIVGASLFCVNALLLVWPVLVFCARKRKRADEDEGLIVIDSEHTYLKKEEEPMVVDEGPKQQAAQNDLD